MDKLADKLAEIAGSIQGPGLEVAKAAARTQAFSALVTNIILACIGAGALYGAHRLWKNDREFENISTIFAMIGGGIFALIGGIAFCMIFDPWIYVTMFSPEQWLAKKALGL